MDENTILVAFILIILSPSLILFFQNRTRRGRVAGNWLLLVGLSGEVTLLYFLDVFAAVTVLWQFLLGSIALAVGLTWVVYIMQRSRITLAIGAVTVLFIVMLRYIDTGPRKPFTRFYTRIDSGMSTEEVTELLEQEFPSDGHYSVPRIHFHDEDSISFQLDPEDGRYNAEFVSVELSDGRVTGKNYSHD